MLPQSCQMLVSMMGSQTPWEAAGYFGLSTNQPRNTLTSCIAKACWVSIRRPAAPGVPFLFHWAIRPPEDSQSQNWPLHSLAARWGILLPWHFVTHLTFATFLFLSWLLCSCWRSQTLLFSDVCAAAAAVNKRFSVSKHTDGENCRRATQKQTSLIKCGASHEVDQISCGDILWSPTAEDKGRSFPFYTHWQKV